MKIKNDIWFNKINYQFLKRILIIYHLLFFLIAYYNIAFNSRTSDGENFIRLALNTENWWSLFGFGTKFMAFLIYPLVKIGFNYFLLALLSSLISLKGFLIYLDLQKNALYKNKLSILVLSSFWLFLPSIHYWTSLLGKDAIIFLLMAMILKAIKLNNFKSPWIYILLLLAFFIRPYSVFILIASALIILVFFTHKSIKIKLCSVGIFLLLGALSLPVLIKKFLKIKEYDGIQDLIFKFFETIQNFNSSNGSHFFDIFKTSYLEKLTILLIRPLFFDASSFFSHIASFQNSIILIILIYYLYLFLFKRKRLTKLSYKFALLTMLLFWIIISTYIFNLGQASRMRVMILPYLFYALSGLLIANQKETIT
ncbi:hypothetical protein [Aurantibacter sp.]|uniref:hypothetical protein n=1 Tax=Aurantibacter sp. TaxID=2807103 RepID=UPI0035C7FB38